uniref:glycosyltransferase family 25 protein n=1 Tax=Thaumasiovibrio occultus TaxID=1891184 RepID=UPI00131C19E4|nr:glycosyltransferase family 25 protein [Thaumasiovibrio occultus]
MKTFVISLAESTERRERVVNAMTNAGIDFEFIDAVDGRKGEHPLLAKYNDAKHCQYHGRPAVPGEIGCYASHYLAWQKCVELEEPIVIFEDDFALVGDFHTAIDICKKEITSHPFIRLEHSLPRGQYNLKRIGDFTLTKFFKVPQCATCYVIHPSAAARFIEKSFEFFLPVDVFVRYTYLHGVSICHLKPHVVEPLAQDSIIGFRKNKVKNPIIKLTRPLLRLGIMIRIGITNIKQHIALKGV